MERTYISGGMVYDGTGKEPFCGDIVINGNTIEAVLPHSEDRFTEKRAAYSGAGTCSDAGIRGCAQAL